MAGTSQARPGSGAVVEWVIDLVMGFALTALAVGSVMVPDPLDARQYPPPDLRLAGLAVLASLPIVLRRRYPATVFAVSLGAWLTIWLLGWAQGVVPACTLFALYAAGAYQPLRRALACLGLMLAGVGTVIVLQTPSWPLDLISLVGFTLVWGGGVSVRRIRQRQQAAVRRALEAERTRAAMAERAVFAERLRIARELHDVVAHTLSVIAVQSGVARHLLGPDQQALGPSLTAIEEASRTALDDLRRMLGILRADPADPVDPAESLAPSPGLDDLELLAATHRATHGPVELDVDAAELPQSVRATVFRIVQEGLTNVRKHAPGASAHVVVRATASELLVQVGNSAPREQAASGTGGFGLTGVRERVSVFGGRLEAGPDDRGGFRLRAVLPLRATEAAR